MRFTIDPLPRRKYQIRKRLLRLLAGLPRPLQRLTIDAAAEAKVHLAEGDCTGLLLYFIRPNDWGKLLRQLHIHVPIIERWAHLLLKLLPVELEDLVIHTYSSRTKAQQQQDIYSPKFPEGLTSLQWNAHGSRIDATVLAGISTLRHLSITKAALCELEAALEGLTGLHSLRMHQVRWPGYTSPFEESRTDLQLMTDLRVLEAPDMWAGNIGGWMALSKLPSLESAHLKFIGMGPEVHPAVSCTQLVLGRTRTSSRGQVQLCGMLQADLPQCLVMLLPALRVLKMHGPASLSELLVALSGHPHLQQLIATAQQELLLPQQLAHLGSLPALQHLELDGLPCKEPQQVLAAAASCPQLTTCTIKFQRSWCGSLELGRRTPEQRAVLAARMWRAGALRLPRVTDLARALQGWQPEEAQQEVHWALTVFMLRAGNIIDAYSEDVAEAQGAVSAAVPAAVASVLQAAQQGAAAGQPKAHQEVAAALQEEIQVAYITAAKRLAGESVACDLWKWFALGEQVARQVEAAGGHVALEELLGLPAVAAEHQQEQGQQEQHVPAQPHEQQQGQPLVQEPPAGQECDLAGGMQQLQDHGDQQEQGQQQQGQQQQGQQQAQQEQHGVLQPAAAQAGPQLVQALPGQQQQDQQLDGADDDADSLGDDEDEGVVGNYLAADIAEVAAELVWDGARWRAVLKTAEMFVADPIQASAFAPFAACSRLRALAVVSGQAQVAMQEVGPLLQGCLAHVQELRLDMCWETAGPALDSSLGQPKGWMVDRRQAQPVYVQDRGGQQGSWEVLFSKV